MTTQQYTDTSVVTISENSTGDVDLADVAIALNQALSDIKSDYANFGNYSDKRRTMVDASWEDAGAEKVIYVVYTFEWDQQSTPPKNTVFGSSESWHWVTNGGNSQSQYIGQAGAPQVLAGKVKANVGMLVYGVMPVNIVSEDNFFSQNSAFATTDNNPWVGTTTLNVVDNIRFFASTTVPNSQQQFIDAIGLNFYREQLRDMINDRCTTLNK